MDVEIRISTSITKWEGPSKVGFTSPSGLGDIEAGAILLATGVRERPRAARMVPGTRPQGVYTTGSLQRFVYQEKLPVGRRAVIVGAELVSLSALMTLMHANVKCVMMTTEESKHQIEFPYAVMKWILADMLLQAPIITDAKIVNIFGKNRVEGIEISRKNGQNQLVECDTLIFTGDWIPENELARLGGLDIDPLTHGPRIDANFQSSIPGVFVAGNLLRGVETADHCAMEGKKAGNVIAKFLSRK
jgi:thioredoxin reductase